jgi:hypothetical protein
MTHATRRTRARRAYGPCMADRPRRHAGPTGRVQGSARSRRAGACVAVPVRPAARPFHSVPWRIATTAVRIHGRRSGAASVHDVVVRQAVAGRAGVRRPVQRRELGGCCLDRGQPRPRGGRGPRGRRSRLAVVRGTRRRGVRHMARAATGTAGPGRPQSDRTRGPRQAFSPIVSVC